MGEEHAFEARLLRLLKAVHPLDRVPRAGYLLRGVCEPESVAAHLFGVSLLTLAFLESCPGRWDPVRALTMALVHDLAESQLMDIPMTVADAHLGRAKSEAEHALLEDLLGGLFPRWVAACREFDVAETPEARLVRGLDKAQMLARVWCYEREGRGCLEEFWANPANFRDYGIPEVRSLFDAILSAAGKKRPDGEPCSGDDLQP
ncbi:MAG TPA: HD domain-containing protein [Candidatus Hydrogenedentes bacterium]|nr:HD domain-containing protein [Candidatus Hydrogenedentota bacterium]